MLLLHEHASLLSGHKITNNRFGIYLQYSSNNTVSGNNITNSSYDGLWFWDSSNNTVYGNDITNNSWGVRFDDESCDNRFFHNNFIDNGVWTQDYANFWDNSVEGNYWSDYNGTDFYSGPYQNGTDSDGIGDTTHSIDMCNVDRFPLMAPINIFDAGTWNDVPCKVHVISNSTVSNFQLNETEKIISFNVTCETGVGFCRVTIPNTIVQNMWQGNYTVLVDGETPLDVRNWTDSTNTYIYFTYLHSEHEVVMIPEFPVAAILPLFVIIALCAALLKKKIKT